MTARTAAVFASMFGLLLLGAFTRSAASLQDPALTVGTLPNGMRYYLRVNRTPAHRAELRLVVNAGSVLEDEDQQGFAHFLEHMAFNGTTHFPEHALIDFVETSGMRFGADLNASTSYDETIYKLTVPTDDPTTLNRALQVLQDWAGGGINIDSTEVVAERGVVMGEWRARALDTASQRVRAHYDSVLFGDSRYTTRKPIGDTTLLVTAEPGPIRRFYEDWYRPELMAVVVVGDFDPAAMEREIGKRFGAIPAREDPRPRLQSVLPASAEPVVDVYRDNVLPTVEVLWPIPPEPTVPAAAMQQRLIAQLLMQHLEQRVFRMRAAPSRPFITAQLEEGRVVRPVDLVGFQLLAWPDSLERGLRAILTEFERVSQHGIPEGALKHQKAVLLRQLEHTAASVGARSSRAYVDAYVQNYLTGEGSLLSAEQELTLAREILPEITPEVMAEAAKFWRQREGLRVLVGLPTFAHVRPPTRESLLALFDSVAHTPLAPDSTPILAEGPLLTELPTPGRIVEESHHARAGITEWKLSNGARVILKPTQSNPDELLMKAWSPGGFSLVPDTLFFTTGRMVAIMMTEAAGLGTHDREALLEELTTTGVRDFKVDIGYSDESISLAGSPKELELLFQMLYLQFTRPRLDSTTLKSWQSLAKYQGRRAFSIHDVFNQLFAHGNRRMLPVSTQLAELADIDRAMAVYHDRFGNAGDFTFTLVGAVTPEQVEPLVKRYLASLPATAAREAPKPPEVAPFRYKIDNTRKIPTALPRAQTLWVFDGPVPTEPAEYLAAREELGTVQSVLDRRLRIRLREELGGTYGVGIEGKTYLLPGERYRLLMSFIAAPERMKELNAALEGVLDTLRTEGATPAELTQVATIQRRQLETQLESNEFWMERIGLYSRLGISLDRIPAPFDHAMTPAEFKAAAQRYLPADNYIHITTMPRDSSSYAGTR
jgi:zinc protease